MLGVSHKQPIDIFHQRKKPRAQTDCAVSEPYLLDNQVQTKAKRVRPCVPFVITAYKPIKLYPPKVTSSSSSSLRPNNARPAPCGWKWWLVDLVAGNGAPNPTSNLAISGSLGNCEQEHRHNHQHNHVILNFMSWGPHRPLRGPWRCPHGLDGWVAGALWDNAL